MAKYKNSVELYIKKLFFVLFVVKKEKYNCIIIKHR